MWLIWKLYTWFTLKQWNKHIISCQEKYKHEKELSAIALSEIIYKLPWTVVNAVPENKYHYHTVVTASASIEDVEKWLVVCERAVVAYNACTREELDLDRPDETYIDSRVHDKITVTEPMSMPLDEYMKVNNVSVDSVYLNRIFALVYSIATELSKIDDTIDKAYFSRRAAPFMDDLYSVITTLVDAGKLHGK